MASILLVGQVFKSAQDINDISNTLSTLPIFPSAYGQFYSSQTQLNLGPSTATPLTYDGLFVASSVSVDLLNAAAIKITTPGTYRILSTVQMDSSGGGPSNTVSVWLAVNGSDVPYTNSVITVSNNDENIVTVEFFYNFSTPGYFEIYYQSPNGQVNATAYPIGLAGPETPSIITSVQRIA